MPLMVVWIYSVVEVEEEEIIKQPIFLSHSQHTFTNPLQLKFHIQHHQINCAFLLLYTSYML